MAEMDPGFPGGKEIAKEVDRCIASFEASLREAPQDKEFSYRNRQPISC
jgi:hypothetical protein